MVPKPKKQVKKDALPKVVKEKEVNTDYKEKIADIMLYINDLHKRIDKSDNIIEEHKAIIATMRGRMGV